MPHAMMGQSSNLPRYDTSAHHALKHTVATRAQPPSKCEHKCKATKGDMCVLWLFLSLLSACIVCLVVGGFMYGNWVGSTINSLGIGFHNELRHVKAEIGNLGNSMAQLESRVQYPSTIAAAPLPSFGPQYHQIPLGDLQKRAEALNSIITAAFLSTPEPTYTANTETRALVKTLSGLASTPTTPAPSLTISKPIYTANSHTFYDPNLDGCATVVCDDDDMGVSVITNGCPFTGTFASTMRFNSPTSRCIEATATGVLLKYRLVASTTRRTKTTSSATGDKDAVLWAHQPIVGVNNNRMLQRGIVMESIRTFMKLTSTTQSSITASSTTSSHTYETTPPGSFQEYIYACPGEDEKKQCEAQLNKCEDRGYALGYQCYHTVTVEEQALRKACKKARKKARTLSQVKGAFTYLGWTLLGVLALFVIIFLIAGLIEPVKNLINGTDSCQGRLKRWGVCRANQKAAREEMELRTIHSASNERLAASLQVPKPTVSNHPSRASSQSTLPVYTRH